MALSGSTDFTRTHKQLISGALRLAHGGKMPTGTNRSNVESHASEALNMMIKQWAADGVGLWKNTEVSIPFSYGGYSYSLGPSGDHASTSLVRTEISTAASSGDTEIVVDSVTGIATTYAIGVELDDGTLQWTTVNGAPSGTTVTLSAALTDDVNVDAAVYCYESGIARPLDITEARIVLSSGTETPLTLLTRNEYMALSDKDSIGRANSIYYDATLDTGTLKVWAAATSVSDYLKVSARLPFDDFDSDDDNADFPVECLRALKWNLADEIMDEFAGSGEDAQLWERRRSRVAQKANQTLSAMRYRSIELGSYFFEAG
jgi:hypothetical protein